MRRLALGLALVLAAPAAAAADVRPLSDAGFDGTPALSGGQVFYANPRPHDLRVLAQPAAGGVPSEIARFTGPPGWELAAGAGGLAMRLYFKDRQSLVAGPAEGPLTVVRRRVPRGSQVAEETDLFAVPGGPLGLERHGKRLRAVLRPPGGPARVLDLPAGADVRHLAAAGSTLAVAVPRHAEVVLLDMPSGAVRGRVPLGDFARTGIQDLAVSEAGDLALSVEDGSGRDFLGWAPAGAAEPRVVLAGDGLGHVATAAGLIAIAGPAVRGDASQVLVLDPAGAEPRVLFRGPPSAYVRSLDFDGRHVAWATDACQLVADVSSPQIDVIPKGPCVRTEAAFTLHVPSSVRVSVRCIATPGRRCRIDLRVYGRSRRLARRVVMVPRGRLRTVRIPVRRGFAVVVGRVVDPDGRMRLAAVL